MNNMDRCHYTVNAEEKHDEFKMCRSTVVRAENWQ